MNWKLFSSIQRNLLLISFSDIQWKRATPRKTGSP